MSTDALTALQALCRFTLAASGADLIVAVEVDEQGKATPVTSCPATIEQAFQLQSSRMLDRDWSSGPTGARDVRLPAMLVGALGRPAHSVLFVPVAATAPQRSGLILIWAGEAAAAHRGLIDQLPQLATAFGQLLAFRRAAHRQQAMRDHFNDLLETVPSGIVVIDGDGHTALVNERAGAVLAIRPGEHGVSALVRPMRELRERCINREELEAVFKALVVDVDYAARTIWNLGEQQFEVDTHPVRSDGQRGRIWLFNDVTAELRMAAQLRSLAESDPLTGIPNRRHFDEQSRAMIAALKAAGKSVSVLMIDIDHFKSINDTYGHQTGDKVLAAIARRCRDALRDRDLLARFGGEEFIALLPTTSGTELAAIGERLRSAIAQSPVMAGDDRLEVRASIGAAGGADDGDTLEDLIARADAALYRAKRGGRNQVVIDG